MKNLGFANQGSCVDVRCGGLPVWFPFCVYLLTRKNAATKYIQVFQRSSVVRPQPDCSVLKASAGPERIEMCRRALLELEPASTSFQAAGAEFACPALAKLLGALTQHVPCIEPHATFAERSRYWRQFWTVQGEKDAPACSGLDSLHQNLDKALPVWMLSL